MTVIAHRLPQIDKAIWNKAGDLSSPIKHKAERCGSGRGRASHTIIPDEVVAQMRFMHECDCKTHKQVREAFPHLSNTYVRNVLDYVLRPNVKPAVGHTVTPCMHTVVAP